MEYRYPEPVSQGVGTKRPSNTALVLVAHGSRNAEANAAHQRLTANISAQLGRSVHPGFLELASPTVSEALDLAAAKLDLSAPLPTLRVLPFFLYPGRHVREHLPELMQAARARHPKVSIELLDPLGEDPALVALAAARLTRDP